MPKEPRFKFILFGPSHVAVQVRDYRVYQYHNQEVGNYSKNGHLREGTHGIYRVI